MQSVRVRRIALTLFVGAFNKNYFTRMKNKIPEAVNQYYLLITPEV